MTKLSEKTTKVTPVGADLMTGLDSEDSNASTKNKNFTINSVGTTVFGSKTTTDLAEGTNEYYTEAKVSANSTVVSKADKTNVIEKDSVSAFIPTLGTHPTNKDYVDTEIISAIAGIKLLGGDGSDGVLNISSGTTTLTLVDDFVERNYSSITISSTALLDITGVSSIGGVAVLKCQGDFTMSGGTIDITGQGGSGGSAENNGLNGRNTFGVNQFGQGGTAGIQSGGTGITGPSSISTFGSPTGFGAGGGGGGGEINSLGTVGGRGGGILVIEVGGDFNFTGGTIQANGNGGGDQIGDGGGGGGGGGGTIVIVFNTLISNTGTIQSNGANGGFGGGVSTSGGGGGGGYSNGGAGSDSSSSAGIDGTSNSWGTGGTGGALPNGGGGGGAGLVIVQNINNL